MPSKPFLVFWYILSACAFGTQRNILHHWASTQIKLSNMLNDMTIDQKSTKSPSHMLDTQKINKKSSSSKRKTTNYFVHLKGNPKKSPQNTKKKERLQTLQSPLYSKETTKNSYGKRNAPTRGITNTSMRGRSNKEQGKTPLPAQP
jgi:hypothetical protein